MNSTQPGFDLEREQKHPDWGDPSWRAIPESTTAASIAVAHLHINDEDLLADPEIALPMRLLRTLASEGQIGGAVKEHVSVMGYQERTLGDWQSKTAPELVAHLRDQGADGLILAPV